MAERKTPKGKAKKATKASRPAKGQGKRQPTSAKARTKTSRGRSKPAARRGKPARPHGIGRRAAAPVARPTPAVPRTRREPGESSKPAEPRARPPVSGPVQSEKPPAELEASRPASGRPRAGDGGIAPRQRRAPARPKSELEHYRAKLLAARAAILKNLEELREELRGLQEPSHELEEWAQEEKDRDILIRLELREKEELSRIQAALGRVEQGTYGQCARCGRRISKERLEEVPTAVFCRNCQPA
jgi:RNA polymerase-binding protein DksA